MKSGLPVGNGARLGSRRSRPRIPDELELISRRIEVLEHRLLLLGLGLHPASRNGISKISIASAARDQTIVQCGNRRAFYRI
jgi:hypothetical protein